MSVEITKTEIFKKTKSVYVSLRILRILIFLDGCHDFLENAERNAWSLENKKRARELMYQNYKRDIQYLESPKGLNIETDNISVEMTSYFLAAIKNLESKMENYENLNSTEKIKKNFIEDIKSLVDIQNINLFDHVKWDCGKSFSEYLLFLLNPKISNNNILIGVDANKTTIGFSALFNNICKILYSDDYKLEIFNSPATAFDAATNSSILNQIIAMSKKAEKSPPSIKPILQGNVYQLNLNFGTKNIIKLEYVKSSEGIVNLKIKNFFGREILDISRKINSKNNSVKFLTTNYRPDDNIFMFKTFGDLGQILSFASYSHTTPNFTNLFISFDYISAYTASLFIKGAIFENVSNPYSALEIFTINKRALLSGLELAKRNFRDTEITAAEISAAMQLQNLNNSNKRPRNSFGSTIKEKLKSVGIRVTKDVNGKRKNLTLKEMNIKAEAFRKLQLKAREKGIKLKTSNGNFKTKSSLEKELKNNKHSANKFG